MMEGNVLYQQWNPLESIPDRLYCEAIHDDYEGFRILLKGQETDSPTFRLAFDSPLAYRNIDEGRLLRTLNLIKDREKASLYEVKNSPWVKWFHDESLGIYEGRDLIHYAIITANDCIDVLTEFAPKAEWLNR
jgi:hypothetical protein